MNLNETELVREGRAFELSASPGAAPDLKDPRVVLSLLETDQVVAAKQRTHFGQRRLSFTLRTLLWSLRVYVVLMLALVLVSVIHAIHAIR